MESAVSVLGVTSDLGEAERGVGKDGRKEGEERNEEGDGGNGEMGIV